MPTYVYQCPACGHEFEKFHKMTAKVRPKCPECGTGAERKITGGAGLLFKGSGFYITDYRKSGGTEAGGDAAKADAPAKADKPAKDAPAKAGGKKKGSGS